MKIVNKKPDVWSYDAIFADGNGTVFGSKEKPCVIKSVLYAPAEALCLIEPKSKIFGDIQSCITSSLRKYDFVNGSKDFFNDLKSNGFKTALVTDMPEHIYYMNLYRNNNLGLNKLFQSIITLRPGEKNKPSPQTYKRARYQMFPIGDGKRKRILTFENDPKGVRAGLAADMDVCAIINSNTSRKHMREMRDLTKLEIEHFHELM